jgi:hypothetical protein
MNDFAKEVAGRIATNPSNEALVVTAHQFAVASILPKYSYNYLTLGGSIIQ